MFDEKCAGSLAIAFWKESEKKIGHKAKVALFLLLHVLFFTVHFKLLYKYISLYISNEIHICLATQTYKLN